MKQQALANIVITSLLVWAPSAHSAPATSSGDGASSLSEVPLFVQQGVEPNLILTLDDSNSMRRALIDASAFGLYRNMSSDINELYYNPDPNIDYTPPKRADGTFYETSWEKAYVSGFTKDLDGDGNEDYVNLEEDYLPTGWFPLTWKDENKSEASVNNKKLTFDSRKLQALQYHPGLTGNAAREGSKAYYYAFKSTCDENTNSDVNNAGCYTKVEIPDDQKQKFANWYSFYRTRMLATQTIANLALADQDETLRVGWQGMLNCFLLDSTDPAVTQRCKVGSTFIDNRVKPFTPEHKENLLAWLEKIPLVHSTPTREAMVRAGNWYKNTTARGPYATYDSITGAASAPTADSPSSCRRNFHILMTDGALTSTSYNRSSYDANAARLKAIDTFEALTDAHDADDSNSILGDGLTNYSQQRPFKSDSHKNLADLAFYYWANDLAPSLDNNIAPNENIAFWDARGNPATWQHMVNFTIGFGLEKLLTPGYYTGSSYTGFFENVEAGSQNWPTTNNDGGSGHDRILDLWHAATNSRGKFFSASDPTLIRQQINGLVESLNKTTPSAALSFSGSTVGMANYSFSTRIDSSDWSGEVRISRLVTATGQPEIVTTSAGTPLQANVVLDAQDANDRNIKFARKTGANFALHDFEWSNLNATEKVHLNRSAVGTSDNKGEQRLAWLRGNRTDARNQGLRVSNKRLGDIVDAAPVYVGEPDSVGLSYLIPEGASYDTFMSSNADRSHRLYISANDGMLHAFNVNLGIIPGSSPETRKAPQDEADFFKEEFAFIPSPIIPRLARLTDEEYDHLNYLDVTPVTSDVYINGSWKTVLIGGMKGARGLYALDITDPDNTSLLWEFTEQSDTSKNSQLLGHTYAKPAIARLGDGQWYVLAANGYDNKNNGTASTGKAALFIIRLSDGALIKTLEVGSPAPNNPNGLSEVALADINGDMITDYAYAGDLYGNMWRFDLNNGDSSAPFGSTSPADWKVGLAGQPLFSAMSAAPAQPQAITTKPFIARHKSQLGHIVLFGTGKYLEPSDHLQATDSKNSFYGIWDATTNGSTSTAVTITRSNLLQQQISNFGRSENFGVDPSVQQQIIRTGTRNVPNWKNSANPSGHQGWYLDFPDGSSIQGGEMVITEGALRGDLLLFETSQLSSTPCENKLDSWLYGIDPISGGRVDFAQFDLSLDDELNLQDQYSVVGGKESVYAVKQANLGAPTVIGDYIYFTTEDSVIKVRYQAGERRSGRQIWQRIED